MGAFFVTFAFFLLAGVPIALALGVGATAYLYFSGNAALIIAFPQRMIAGVDQFVLLTIPLFLLAGALMNVGGITDRIVEFARVMIGHRRGGLSSVTVLSSTFFAGISGSATAEAAALGSILIPSMQKQGLPASYASALVGVSAIVGPIIPPSITMIVYGVLASVSIGQLFLAGILPGLLLTVGFLIYASWIAKRRGYPASDRATWSDVVRLAPRTVPALMLPLIIVGGLRGGVFTASEAAAIAVVYAFLVGLATRELTTTLVWNALSATTIVTSALMFIIAMASMVAFVLTLERVPQQVAEMVLQISDEPYFILLMLNIALLFLGMFLEPITILILAMPVLLEMSNVIGMDPIQFGVMVVLNVVIGMATPPVGICLFIVCSISGRPLAEVSREALPLIGISVLVLAIVALVPWVSLILPQLLF